MDFTAAFPKQKLPFKSKGNKWRRDCLDWAASKTYFAYSPVRQDVVHMKMNYDLVNGIIHMEDVARLINPGGLSTITVPDKIQHYPVINSKLNTLRGEEAARVFDWRVVVTNPFSISKIEEDKKAELQARVLQIVEDTSLTDEQAQRQLQELQEFFDYDWQDLREMRANELLRHYSKELNFKQLFNDGFMDALVCGMEVYESGIAGGEPYLTRLNPLKLRVFRSGYSNRIEDASLIIYEDYWSPEKVVDYFYDELTKEDIKWLTEEIPDVQSGQSPVGAAGNYNDAFGYIGSVQIEGEDGIMVDGTANVAFSYDGLPLMDGGLGSSLLPYDVAGNVRVVRCWWKSKRLIYMVKSFDPETGDEVFDFYPETYVPDTDAGEVATKLWVNEMWEGTKVGEKIYVGIRPCIVQHNSLSNPSRCHAGIVGTIYNINESKPYSMVDAMKPYNYLYDVVSAKIVDLIASNWGKIVVMDLAKKPKDWEVEKWMYFARTHRVLIEDSFKEGNKGASRGKLAGGLNNASKGYIDADWGNSIQNYINILTWSTEAMSNLVGINRQREGNTYNRETVGGIERAVLQSSYITDWLFQKHDDTKKRACESFLEESKGALRGRSKKFQYIMSDNTRRIMDIPGDEYCECDYGLVVDNSADIQKLNSQLETIAQAAAQNNSLDSSSLIKLFTTVSVQEKIKIVERGEKRMQAMQQQQQEVQAQIEQQKAQAEMQKLQYEMEYKDKLNARDNETRIQVAQINSKAEELRLGIYETQNNIDLRNQELDIEREKLAEEIRQFDKSLKQSAKEASDKNRLEEKKIAAQKEIARMRPKQSNSNKK